MKFKEVPATLTTVEIFENLKKDNLIVRESTGSIVKCANFYVKPTDSSEFQDDFDANEIEVNDLLRKVINHGIYSRLLKYF